MQKVSKQSLAMIALSILLAISIALTFTFAALSDTKKATGTITFSGGGSVVWNTSSSGVLEANGANGDAKFTLTETNFTFAADGKTATLKTGVFTDEDKVTFSNESDNTMYYKVSVNITGLGGNATSSAVITADNAKGSIAKDGSAKVFTLSEILPNFALTGDNLGNVSTVTIEITAEFNYNAAY